MYGDQGIDLRDFPAMLRRRAGLLVTVAGAVTLLGIFVASILPNQYEAYATLLVEPQTVSKELIEAGVQESDLNNRLHLMTMEIRSRARLSKVIDDLGLYREESKEMPRESIIDMMNDRIRVEPILPELAAGQRQREIEINTFRIFFRADSPARAAAVANRLAQDFIDQHIQERVQLSGDTSEFIRTELARLTERIREVDDQISQVKSENRGRLPEDAVSNQRMLERAVDNLRAAQRELAVAESDAAFYRQQVQMSVPELQPGQEPVSPERRLQMLELQLAELRARGFTDKHPDMIAARGEMESLRARIAREAQEEGEEGEGQDEVALSPLQQSARAEAERAELRAESARREIERVQAQIEAYEARLAATPRVAETLASLERQYQHLSEQYQEFSDKLQTASVAADMESRQKGEKFRLLERAFPPPAPASPNRKLIVGLALFLGLAFGGGVAVLLEALDNTFRSSRSLQPALGLPVLAAIPRVVLESDLRARRRRRVWQSCLAGVVVLVVLAGSVAGNWMVNGTPGAVKEMLGMGAGDEGQSVGG